LIRKEIMKTCVELLKDWRLAFIEKVSMKVSDENLAWFRELIQETNRRLGHEDSLVEDDEM